MPLKTRIDLDDLQRGLTIKSKVIVKLLILNMYDYYDLSKLDKDDFLVFYKNNLDFFNPQEKSFVEQSIKKETDSQYAFCNPSGRSYSASDLENILIRRCKIIGYDYKGLNDIKEHINI